MIKIVNKIEEADYITHSGTMHADEVFSTAFLHLYRGDILLFRTNEVKESDYPDKMIYDIGRGKYDHHQIDRKVRDNNIPYCSFGLIWKEFGLDFLKKRNIEYAEDVHSSIDKDFIEGIDAIDNGIFPKVEAPYKIKNICDIIKIFNPSYGSNQNESEQFLKAVDVATKILEEEIASVTGRVKARKKVETKIEEAKKKHYLILEEFMPYEEAVFNNDENKEIYFAIYPSNRGGYAAKTISVSPEDKTNRLPFPEEWAGLDKTLADVTKVEGATFCHLGRFLVCATNKEDIIKLVEMTINSQNNDK